MKILFIEDEGLARVGIQALLENERGHAVDVAETAHEAIEKMRKKAYDLLLLDIMISPGENLKDVPFREAGKELAVRLRGRELGELKTVADVPILAITAVSDLDALEALQDAGNVRVLQKPIDPEGVLPLIDELLGAST